MYHTIGNAILYVYNYAQSLIYILVALFLTAVNQKKFLRMEGSKLLQMIAKAELFSVSLLIGGGLGAIFIPDDISAVSSGKVALLHMLAGVICTTVIVTIFMALSDYLGAHFKATGVALFLGIFIFCIFELLLLENPVIEDWAATYYALDYSLGFGSRLFIGSLLHIFYDDFLSNRLAVRFVLVFMGIFALLLSYLCTVWYCHAKENEKRGVIFIILAFLVSPASFGAMAENFGRLEVYGYFGILVFILWGTIFSKKFILKYLGYLFISLVMMLIYQGNIFLAFPAMFAVMLTECVREEGWIKKEIFGTAFTTFMTGIFFFVTQFYNPAFEGTDEHAMKAYIAGKTDMSFASGPLIFEYFRPLKKTWETINYPYFSHEISDSAFLPWIGTAFTALLMMPVIVLLGIFWKKAFLNYKVKGYGFFENPISWMFAGFIMIIPDFLLNIDWGRWFIALVFVQVCVVSVMMKRCFAGANETLGELSELVTKYRWAAVLLIVYLYALGNFYDCGFLDTVYKMISVLIGVPFPVVA